MAELCSPGRLGCVLGFYPRTEAFAPIVANQLLAGMEMGSLEPIGACCGVVGGLGGFAATQRH